jgi:hypothetical protein
MVHFCDVSFEDIHICIDRHTFTFFSGKRVGGNHGQQSDDGKDFHVDILVMRGEDCCLMCLKYDGAVVCSFSVGTQCTGCCRLFRSFRFRVFLEKGISRTMVAHHTKPPRVFDSTPKFEGRRTDIVFDLLPFFLSTSELSRSEN